VIPARVLVFCGLVAALLTVGMAFGWRVFVGVAGGLMVLANAYALLRGGEPSPDSKPETKR